MPEDVIEGGGEIYPLHAHCIFCETGRDEIIAARLANENNVTAFVPHIVNEECHSGVWEKHTRRMLPGYIFLYSDEAVNAERIRRTDGVLRFLKYEDGEYDLRGDDRLFAEWIYKAKGTVGISTAVKEGTKIRVVGGPLVDYAGSILEVKRQKRLAKVAITVGNITREVWMSFEWLEPENMQEQK